jgi:hypothetical protein
MESGGCEMWRRSRGAPEMEFLGDAHEVAQVPEFEIHRFVDRIESGWTIY